MPSGLSIRSGYFAPLPHIGPLARSRAERLGSADSSPTFVVKAVSFIHKESASHEMPEGTQGSKRALLTPVPPSGGRSSLQNLEGGDEATAPIPPRLSRSVVASSNFKSRRRNKSVPPLWSTDGPDSFVYIIAMRLGVGNDLRFGLNRVS